MGGRLARLERSAPVLTLFKLANVGLSMLWGFAVTYVFVRVLEPADFRAFLLLVAFNNFTISAEFGLTNIIYARLRRFWLGQGEGAFRLEEIGALFVALLGLILLASFIILGGLALGWIVTGVPLLFLLFFIASALNVQALLAKRALAAIDRNLMWEGLDLGRRLCAVIALVSVLLGFDLLASVVVQLVSSLIAIALAMWIVHRALGMRVRQWLAWRSGGGHMRRTYLGDIGASAALTASEIIAYNAPYFTLAALGQQTGLLLLFDFAFKMSRAVSTAIRAAIEAHLPRATRSFYAHDRQGFDQALRRAGMVALGLSGIASLLLLAIGQRIFDQLFAGHAVVSLPELLLTCAILLALSVICVSVYVQGALGRFTELLRRSVPFLIGSLLLAPATVLLSRIGGDTSLMFMVLLAALFVGVAGLHLLSLRQLRRSL